ncbi:hypothetical protein [Paracoccus shandongensis]|uniref:hypothetical protein n=1 Tax=Paracoccus shandongensis TaxID=2816048 RepID=UPI001A8F4330|nr:hypothetical protein [Paracoccus shandongensis]
MRRRWPFPNWPLLLHFAETDKNVNKGGPALEAALKEHGKSHERTLAWLGTYPG